MSCEFMSPLSLLERRNLGMPHCRNCESFVTEQYVRVFAPTGMNHVRVCPSCEDKLRDGAEVRKAQAPRQTNA